ncbi:hypothetical protein GF325_07085, partial [Candidatus Bathyarchaeota archaeon]|nr:hypothetical protein [Candidatus Bathyarchaeota archaeon]
MVDRGKKNKIIAVSVIVIVAIGAISGLAFFLPDGGNPVVPGSITFSEVNDAVNPADEYIELYCWEAPGVSTEGWQIKSDGNSITLPKIQNLDSLTYIILRRGTGTDELDASDKKVTIYQSTLDVNTDDDWYSLVTSSGVILDYIYFGSGLPDNPQADWTGSGIQSIPGAPEESWQMWGEDLDNKTNWIFRMKTPATANIDEFVVENASAGWSIPVVLGNGLSSIEPDDDGSKNVEYSSRLVGDVMITGTPAPWTSNDKIKEMVDYTLKYYKNLGLPSPYLGRDGKMKITIGYNASKTYTTGSCSRVGNIKITIGSKSGMAGNVTLKNVVEHEIMHAVQASESAEGAADRWGTEKDNGFTEGMAVWGGITSTMGNYNLTWTEAMQYLKDAGSHNWWEHWTNTHTYSLFPFENTWSSYIGWGMFFKFLNETYGGPSVFKKILERVETWYSKDKKGWNCGYERAIEKVTGKKFEDLWHEFYVWSMDGSATKANGFPPFTHKWEAVPPPGVGVVTHDGPNYVGPWCTDKEFVNCSGKTQKFSIRFDINASNRFVITAVFKHKDGSEHRVKYKWPEHKDVIINIDPNTMGNITFYKTRIGKTGDGYAGIELTGTNNFHYSGNVHINEVQAAGSDHDQYIEISTWDEQPYDLAGWTLETSHGSLPLMPVDNLYGNSHLMIRFGMGADDLDASDGHATMYLGPGAGIPYLDPLDDFIALKNDTGGIVDYFYYSGMAPPGDPYGTDPTIWDAGDASILPNGDPMESMQRWGGDLNNSTNWYVNLSSPNEVNAFEFVVVWQYGIIPVRVHNGITFELPGVATEDFRLGGGESVFVTRGTPASWVTREQIWEMANFSLDFYIQMGFPIPELGPDGMLDIFISNSSQNHTTGACFRQNGTIIINVGQTGGMAGLVGLKNVVEHEIMHAVTAQAHGGTHDHWGNDDDDESFNEGIATWAGLASTMAN